jgi:hypothetical protein
MIGHDVLSWVFAGSQVIALVWLLVIGYTHRYPWFCMSLLCWSFQAVTLALANQYDLLWCQRSWATREGVLLVLTAVAVAEAIMKETSRMEHYERFCLQFGAIVAPGVLAVIIWKLEQPTPRDSYELFLCVRSYVWVALTLSCTILKTYSFVKGTTGPWVHGRLICILMVAHALISPVAVYWFGMRIIFRAVTILCMAGWVIFTPRFHPLSDEYPGSPHALPQSPSQ